MDTDFHFFGTGTAAINSGFSGEEATWIANAAEFVDFFDSNYWSYWMMKEGKQQKLKIDYPHLSCQSIDWKMIGDYDENLWNAFHFPPGNRAHKREDLAPYIGKNTVPDWVPSFEADHEVRETKLSPSQTPLLCRPFSPCALHMALDTINKYRAIRSANKNTLPQLLKEYLGNIPHIAPDDAKTLALVFLGVRMHVLSDTWAHQDFSGIASKEINGAGTLNYVYASKQSPQILEDTTWSGTLWALASDTDCAAAPDAPGSAACRGHGQMGHFPDYSWLTFIYPAAWLKNGVYLERHNPQQYKKAWYWINTFMANCQKDIKTDPKTNLHPEQVIPSEITRCIETPHKLDSKKLFAVGESERLWGKTGLAHTLSVKKRWNADSGKFTMDQRRALGVIGDLPTTRLGTVDIAVNSPLHLMELASAIHYAWCVKWAKDHPEFQWKPKPKGQ